MSGSPEITERRDFWTEYQPGFRFSSAEVGTPEFFAEVAAHRYALEPAIKEMADFGAWEGKDVLEAGCGIATDGMQFIRAGARYTGMDFSPSALEIARHRFDTAAVDASLVRGSIAEMPFDAGSFDLVYSNGVIHHLPETRRVVDEMHRVLRPGGQATVMVYHRDSLNFYASIMVLRRLLAALLFIPGADRQLAAATGEPLEVFEGHRELMREHGLRYLTDPSLFLSNNTDGPGNPLSKVYSRRGGEKLFSRFDLVRTDVRFLNLRVYPGGDRLAATKLARRLERRWGWHLWIRARKA
jgi:SAM-dependent methyltransferase